MLINIHQTYLTKATEPPRYGVNKGPRSDSVAEFRFSYPVQQSWWPKLKRSDELYTYIRIEFYFLRNVHILRDNPNAEKARIPNDLWFKGIIAQRK